MKIVKKGDKNVYFSGGSDKSGLIINQQSYNSSSALSFLDSYKKVFRGKSLIFQTF